MLEVDTSKCEMDRWPTPQPLSLTPNLHQDQLSTSHSRDGHTSSTSELSGQKWTCYWDLLPDNSLRLEVACVPRPLKQPLTPDFPGQIPSLGKGTCTHPTVFPRNTPPPISERTTRTQGCPDNNCIIFAPELLVKWRGVHM